MKFYLPIHREKIAKERKIKLLERGVGEQRKGQKERREKREERREKRRKKLKKEKRKKGLKNERVM
jgi:hypothetical protein